MKNLLLLAAFILANWAFAQCPYFFSCPIGSQIYCDYSTNDTLYWHSPPYTWNPSLMRFDLPEADAEISIVARDSCGGQNFSVEYTLFLDLDGNDTAETVIRSSTTPPSGKVLYNNILSPNYALGDTIEFDHRTSLSDSMKYRFGLEITHFADSVVAHLKWTTGIENLNYSTPELPLGKHRIVWRIEQGGVERFCEYGIEVKDCAPPVVTCVAPFSVNLSPPGVAFLSDFELTQSASDNLTPPEKLTFSISAPWFLGNGFPTDQNGNPISSIMLFCAVAYNTYPFEVWVKDLAGNTDSCITYVTVMDNLEICGPMEPIHISACAKTTPWNEGIEEVRIQIDGTNSFGTLFSFWDNTDANGCGFILNNIPVNSDLSITPSRNDNPLNGVTTYDLVLMSKHILAIEPLNSPYKMIAADANKSGSITTFDIVEIRKLILGIHDSLPNNTSWRFLDKSFVFPNAQNPFQTTFPENVVLQDWLGSPSSFEFVGFKVGDVNNTAIPNASAPPLVESRSPSFLSLPDLELKTGEIYEIPIRATEIADWVGLQFSLDFDPEMIDIEVIESSALPDFDQNNWAQPRVGRLTLSWSDARATHITPGVELFRLRIKAHADIQLSKIFRTLEKLMVHPEAYDLEGVAQPLQIVFSENSTTETAQVFAPQPNPTTAGATLPIQLLQHETIRLEVFDLTGKLLWDNELILEKGSHALEIPASAMSQSGMYLWRAQVEDVVRTGKIIRS